MWYNFFLGRFTSILSWANISKGWISFDSHLLCPGWCLNHAICFNGPTFHYKGTNSLQIGSLLPPNLKLSHLICTQGWPKVSLRSFLQKMHMACCTTSLPNFPGNCWWFRNSNSPLSAWWFMLLNSPTILAVYYSGFDASEWFLMG